MNVQIEVRPIHIEHAWPYPCPYSNPLARAARAVFCGARAVSTTSKSLWVEWRRFALPEEARQFLSDFYQKKAVEPFTFSVQYEETVPYKPPAFVLHPHWIRNPFHHVPL